MEGSFLCEYDEMLFSFSSGILGIAGSLGGVPGSWNTSTWSVSSYFRGTVSSEPKNITNRFLFCINLGSTQGLPVTKENLGEMEKNTHKQKL